jgi:hypothetical protein
MGLAVIWTGCCFRSRPGLEGMARISPRPQMKGTYVMNPWLRPSSQDFQAMGVGAPVLFSFIQAPPGLEYGQPDLCRPQGRLHAGGSGSLEDCAGYGPFFAILPDGHVLTGFGISVTDNNVSQVVLYGRRALRSW